MDAYHELMKRTRRRQRVRRIVLGVITPLVTITALCAVFLYLNHFHVAVTLNGDQEITLEVGTPYIEEGVQAVFSGKFFPNEAVKLESITSGSVDSECVGTYTIEYDASFGIWKGSAAREVHVVDSVAPVFFLKSSRASYTIPGEPYEEEGFIAMDNADGDISDWVQRTEKGGKVIYSVEDSSGNHAQITRDIVYYDPIAPELTLTDGERLTIDAGDDFEDPGYLAMDNSAGDITDRVEITGEVNVYRAGTYELHYYVEDVYDNAASAVRTVEVKAKPQPETVKPEEKVIYLTFDDGPGPHTPKLLEVLKEYDVKATFFVCNTDYVDLLTDIAAEGHSIGIHSGTHTYSEIYASEDAYFADLKEMQRIIEDKTGITTTLVRFPGGGSNTVSRFNPGIMTRLVQALHDMGYQYFDWNVDSNDAGGAKTSKRVVRNVTEGIEGKKHAIVLQHDIKGFSVNAVEDIILWGLENGYEFRALDATSPTFHHGINN